MYFSLTYLCKISLPVHNYSGDIQKENMPKTNVFVYFKFCTVIINKTYDATNIDSLFKQ